MEQIKKDTEIEKTTSKPNGEATKIVTKKPVVSTEKENNKKSFRNNKRKPFQRNNKPLSNLPENFSDKVIKISRVTKVVKGGKRFSFAAFVVAGNKKGQVGLGHGKANEVQDAIKKAQKNAIKNLINVPIVNTTIPHEIKYKFLATKLLLKPSKIGKGLIVSQSVRPVVELAGIANLTAKVYGSRTVQNAAKAAINALKKLKTAKEIAHLRDVSIKKLLSLRDKNGKSR